MCSISVCYAGCVNWPDLAWIHGEEAIEEDKNTNQGSRDQHAGVPAQPGKVKTYFLTKVPPERETERWKVLTVNLNWPCMFIYSCGCGSVLWGGHGGLMDKEAARFKGQPA